MSSLVSEESKSEEEKKIGGGTGGVGEGGGGGFQPKKKTTGIRLFFVLMLYIKFQVPGSSGSLVLTQTKGVTDR